MGSGASKNNTSQQSGDPRSPRPAQTAARRRDEFQEVPIRAPVAGRPGNMSSRNHEASRVPVHGDNAPRNRYGRHATSSSGQNSLQYGQSGAATARSSPRTRTDLQKVNAANGEKPPDTFTREADVTFETFTHNNGREFICAVRNGKRFYLDDWHSHEWQPFPERWHSEGQLVPMDDNYKYSASSSNEHQKNDDREGFLNHPQHGHVPTYLMEEKHYVHFFYDQKSGSWLRLPIGWELHHPLVKQMVEYVEETLPSWKDRADILSCLRACNYNPDECIGIYLTLEGDEWLRPKHTLKDVEDEEIKNQKIVKLTEKLQQLESELTMEKKTRMEVEKQLADLEEKFSKVSVEATSAQKQMEAMQQSRPKTARPKTPAAIIPEGASIFDLQQLNRKVQNLHKSHVHLKMDVLRNNGSLTAIIKEAIKAAADLKKSGVGSQHELEEIRALYQKEALQRRLLYNQLQELRGNIRVFCRPRRDERSQNCLRFPSDQDILITSNEGNKKTYSFDKVYTTDATQEQIFADTQPIITSCVDGYNVCLLAYGQTGSGKTFTMMGPENNPGINIRLRVNYGGYLTDIAAKKMLCFSPDSTVMDCSDPFSICQVDFVTGNTPERAITELLKVCDERAETKAYSLKVSMVEIYNETIQDLLTEDTRTLDLQMIGNSVKIPNIMEMPVIEVRDIKEAMRLGDKNRKTASTKMNSSSSRSHLVLMLTVEGEDKVTGAISRGVLTLCDLAGSERISKSEATGQRLVEAAAINKSLSALGQVFSALRESQLHIPYRNSKLTQILRPCLGGDAKACLFVNISPDSSNYSETCNTLEFGSNARQVALGQAKQNIQRKSGFPPK